MHKYQEAADSFVAICYAQAQAKYGQKLDAKTPTIVFKGASTSSTSLKQAKISINPNLETIEAVEDAIRHEMAHYVLGTMTGEGCHRDSKGGFLSQDLIHTKEWEGLVKYFKSTPTVTEMVSKKPAGVKKEETPPRGNLGDASLEDLRSQYDKTKDVVYIESTCGGIGAGKQLERGFEVYEGSKVSNKYPIGYLPLRKRLIESGVIDEETMRFTKDYVFKDGTTAASIIYGCAMNGNSVWRTTKGKYLKDIEV